MKKLAISILNWNNIKDTIDCLDSVYSSGYNIDNFDIYILDNGSEKIEKDVLIDYSNKKSNIYITLNEINIGFTGGNNQNLELILKNDYEYILLLNNDCIIPEGFFDLFIKKTSLIKDLGIFGPIIKNTNGTIQTSGNFLSLWAGFGKIIRNDLFSFESKKTDYVSGACFLLKRKILDEVGLLDDRFFAYWEETDFCFRARKKGFNTYVFGDLFIYHKEESAKQKIRPYYTYFLARNRILFLKKNANIFQFTISFIFLLVFLIFIFPKKFGAKNLKYYLTGVKDGIIGKYGKCNL